MVKWESLNELDVIGYHIERAPSADGPWTRVTDSLVDSKAMGSPIGAAYDYLDATVEAGEVYYYRLVSVKTDSSQETYDPVMVTVPTVGEPLDPPSLSAVHRVFIPMVFR